MLFFAGWHLFLEFRSLLHITPPFLYWLPVAANGPVAGGALARRTAEVALPAPSWQEKRSQRLGKPLSCLLFIYHLFIISLFSPFFPFFFPFFSSLFFLRIYTLSIYYYYRRPPSLFCFNWYKIYPLNPSYFGKDPPALLFPCVGRHLLAVCIVFYLCFGTSEARAGILGFIYFYSDFYFYPLILFYFILFSYPSIYCLVGVRSGMAAQQGMSGRNWQQHEEVWGGRKGGCGCENPGGWGSGAERREGETSK